MRVLVIRLRLIGDVVFTTPLIRALRRQFPDGHLSYLVEPAAAPVVHGNPHLNTVIVVPRRRGLQRIADDVALARRLRRERYDVVIDMHGGPRSAWLTWATRAPMRIGYRMKGRAWMYTHRVERARDLTPRHAVVNQWDLLAPLGIASPEPARDAVEMAEDTAVAERLERRLRDAAILGHPLVVVHVSAGNPFRRWPEASFAILVAALAQQDPRRRILLTSGPSDLPAARRIADEARRQLGPLAIAVPDAGEFDLQELHALVARAAVYIGGDSGPLHVAATTRTPIVELLGPTLPERSRPWRDPRWFAETIDVGALPCRPCHQRHCAPGDFRCLTQITPERVASAAERALAANWKEADV